MDCCAPHDQLREETMLLSNSVKTPSLKDDRNQICAACESHSQPVTRKTVLLMLRSELIERAREGDYRFCAQSHCETVYFNESTGESFTTSDLRLQVGVKESADPIPLCYCFGFDEREMREEILKTGKTTIPERIKSLIKEKMCACPQRNPSGVCCVREVTSVAKRLKQEARISGYGAVR